MKDFLQELKDILNDKEYMEKFSLKLKFKDDLKKKHINKLKSMYNDQKSFDDLVNKIISKHDDNWVNRCYKNGIMPHPWELMYTLFDIAENEGRLIKPIDGLTENFPSIVYNYKYWQFAITHGQGSVCSIYYKKKLMYRD